MNFISTVRATTMKERLCASHTKTEVNMQKFSIYVQQMMEVHAFRLAK